ncbi:3957_t:CDS:2 [Funneliformis geosporum]|nr:3957_t:CDS:2 [Funneliformis geosporum]
MYTHVYQLAQEIKKGTETFDSSIEIELYQVPETLPQEVLTKMHAPPKPELPIITADKLAEADGFLFGFPTRFGSMPAQFKAFLDSTGHLWSGGSLNNKFAGIFSSTATQHGGQETTAFTAITYLAHHGIIFVPLVSKLPYFGQTDEVIGGGPWGSGTITGSDASRPISDREKEIAKDQGKHFAQVVSTYVKGKKVIEIEKKKKESSDEIKTVESNNLTRSTTNTEKKKKSKKNWFCCGKDELLD